jgi:hypothetical protein
VRQLESLPQIQAQLAGLQERARALEAVLASLNVRGERGP